MKQNVFLLLVCLLFAVFFAGCGQVLHTLDRITVSPGSKSLIISGTQQFTATGYDNSGKVVSFTPTWTVEGTIGAISTAGLFTATFEGSGRVVASSGNIKGYANISVTTGDVSSVIVTPSSASLYTGNSQQFTAVAKNSFGGTIPDITFNWTVIGGIGTVDATGYFTAEAGGTGSVEAEAVIGGIDTGKRGYSAVTVSKKQYNVVITPEACTYVSSVDSSTKYSEFSPTTEVHCGFRDSDGSQLVSLLRFNLSSIPATSTVESVSFKFNVLDIQPLSSSIHVRLKCLAAAGWGEPNVNYTAYEGYALGETIIDNVLVTTSDNTVSGSEIKGVVASWINGSLENDGFIMEQDPSDSELHYFIFRGRSSAIYKPELSITYWY